MRTPNSICIAVVAAMILSLGTAAAQQSEARSANAEADPAAVESGLESAGGHAPAAVTNAPGDVSLVRDVDAPTAQPFHVELIPNFNSGSPSTIIEVLAAVPADKRLVVNHVSARLFEVSGSSFYVSIREEILGVGSRSHWIPGRELGLSSSSSAVFVVSETTALVFEPGSRVSCSAHRGVVGSMPARGFSVTVSGYFVDVP